MARFRILSMDGGPQGANWMRVLRKIEEQNPGFLSRVDLLVGCSYGSLSALYLGRHLGSLERGESALELIDGCLRFTEAALKLHADGDAYSRLLVGKESMYSNATMEAAIADEQNVGRTTKLSDMTRRVVIAAMEATAPWAPKIYDSARDKDASALEIGLESPALPVMLPLRNGRADGAFVANNPSMYGITHALSVANAAGVSLDDIVLLSLGGDSGSSSLTDIITPWTRSADTDLSAVKLPQVSIDTDEKGGKDAQLLQQQLNDFWGELKSHLSMLEDPQFAVPRFGTRFLSEENHLQPAGLDMKPEGNSPWGWRLWVAYPLSPLYLYQVVITTMGLSVAQQSQMLLGDRALRLAPLTLLSTSWILLMAFGLNLDAVVSKDAQLTADLWANPLTSTAYKFSPDIATTQRFVTEQWMS